MKTFLHHLVALISIGAVANAQHLSAAVAKSVPSAPGKLVYTIQERGLHHKVWTSVSSVSNHLGRLMTRTNSYIELGSGMHHQDQRGNWVESKPLIEITTNGAAAVSGSQKVFFSENINSPAAVNLTLPDGKQLRSRIFGLSYFDSSTGQAVLLASLMNSTAALLPPNQILYRDAFDNVRADVQYVYHNLKWERRELHHVDPQRNKVDNSPLNLRELTPDWHAEVDPFRKVPGIQPTRGIR